MRRVKILLYWIFGSKNNVSLTELVQFLFKPQVLALANTYIKEIVEHTDGWTVTFKSIPQTLYWPKECPVEGIYQVSTETFDTRDWHYYQKKHTEVMDGEVLVDVGAAEGLFALSVIDRCEKAILIEPNDFFVFALKKTFSGYREKVTIHPVAVGETPGVIHFDPNSLTGKIDAETGMEKELNTIDALLRDEKKITFLKADVEGFEESMLKGAEQTIKKHRPKLAITSYHPENNPQEIIRIIKGFVPEYNHTVKGIIETGGKPVMIHFWI